MRERFNNKKGFTLIEMMISVFLLTVGMLALFQLQLTAIKMNDINKQYLIAQDTATREIESVRTIGYGGLRNNTTLTTNFVCGDTNDICYTAGYNNIAAQFQFLGAGDTACAASSTYCVFRGITSNRYNYTVKLSINPNYLTYPTLAQGNMQVYWMSQGRLKQIDVAFFVGG